MLSGILPGPYASPSPIFRHRTGTKGLRKDMKRLWLTVVRVLRSLRCRNGTLKWLWVEKGLDVFEALPF